MNCGVTFLLIICFDVFYMSIIVLSTSEVIDGAKGISITIMWFVLVYYRSLNTEHVEAELYATQKRMEEDERYFQLPLISII
jgi:hypothetical protein